MDAKSQNHTTITNQSEGSQVLTVVNEFCQNCKKPGHTKQGCWMLHPELMPTCGLCGGKKHWSSNCRKKD